MWIYIHQGVREILGKINHGQDVRSVLMAMQREGKYPPAYMTNVCLPINLKDH